VRHVRASIGRANGPVEPKNEWEFLHNQENRIMMIRSNVREWFDAFDRASRERDQGRAELAWLGLVDCDDEEARAGDDCFERSAAAPQGGGRRPCADDGDEGMSLAKAFDPATRLGLLMGVVLIASLTTVLFCG
jgi:hypothetical protein